MHVRVRPRNRRRTYGFSPPTWKRNRDLAVSENNDKQYKFRIKDYFYFVTQIK